MQDRCALRERRFAEGGVEQRERPPVAGVPVCCCAERGGACDQGIALTLKVVEPPKRKGGGKVADVKDLVTKLRTEAKVIS